METNVSASKAGLKYGVYGGIFMVIYSLVVYLTGAFEPTDPDPPALFRYLPWLFLAVFMFLAIKYFKESNEEFLSIGEGIVTAIVTGLVMAVFSIVWMAIYFYVIDPEGMDTLMQNALEQAQERNPELTDEQLEASEGFIKMLTSIPALSIFVLIGNAIAGLIIGLIISLFMKNAKE